MTDAERIALVVAAAIMLAPGRSSAMPTEPAPSSAAPLPHAWARPILARAYHAVFGREATRAELQFLAAWSWVESRYGRAGGLKGSHNWGSVLCGPADPAERCFAFEDRFSDGTIIHVRARKYADDDEGAADLVRQAMVVRPRSGAAIREGVAVYRPAVALRRERYYGGTCPITTAHLRAVGKTSEEIRRSPDCAREATTGRALAVWQAIEEIARDNKEPVAWQLGSYEDGVAWYEGHKAAPSSGGWGLGPSLRQSDVTAEMSAWATDVRRSDLPIGAITGPRTFIGKDGQPMDVLAHVETHPPTPTVPHPHRGVGLYHTPGTMPATPPPATPAPSSGTVYRSTAALVHPAGFVDLPGGMEITRLAMLDDLGLFARLGAADAAKMLAAQGMRLPTALELVQLRNMALFIPPVTLPTDAMVEAAGVPKPWRDAQGRDTPQMALYRGSHMASRAWAELHDGRVAELLRAAAWTGQPVANDGKHWTHDGGILGWWFAQGGQWQGLSHKHEPGEVPHVPPLGSHTDYGTTIHAVRKKGTPV